MSYKVIFDGFDTLEDARAFADWYSGQGEQDLCEYIECATNGKITSADTVSITAKGTDVFVQLNVQS